MADAGPVLLDTDAYTWLQLRRQEWVELLRGRELVLSFVTIGEVLHGRHKAGWGATKIRDELTRLEAFRTIAGTREVAERFGELARRFDVQVPSNDLWIAACALAVPIPLATGDRTHFDPITKAFGLEVVRPPAPAKEGDPVM